MRAREFLTDAVSNRRVTQYIKQHHPKGEWTASANNMVMQYPKYELAWVSVDQLKIDSDEPVDDPYGRVIDVDQSYASRLSSQDIEDNPIVIDTQGHILDGNHRAWQAKQLGMDMIPAYQPVKELAESAERGVIYTKPDFTREWGEAARYPEFQQLGREAWINIAAQGRVVDWSSLDSVGNVELDLASLDQNKVRSVAVDVKRNQVELPIVGQWADGTLDLIAGNTRIATLLAQGHNPKVWLVDVPGNTELTEDADLNYQGNCTDDDVIEHIFGDATGFAQAVDEYGDEFVLDDLVVKYNPEEDIHYFYYKN